MSNLDRFSSPLTSERVNPYFIAQAIEEQREENKKATVQDFISSYWCKYYQLPNAELIQETFYQLDLDEDLIKDQLLQF